MSKMVPSRKGPKGATVQLIIASDAVLSNESREPRVRFTPDEKEKLPLSKGNSPLWVTSLVYCFHFREYSRNIGHTYKAFEYDLRGTRLSISTVPWILSSFPSSARIAFENLRAAKVEWRVNNLELPVDGALEGLSFEPTTLRLVAHDVIVLRTFSAGQRYTLVGEAACFRSSAALIAFQVGGSGRAMEKWGITARRKLPYRSSIFSISLIVIKSRAIKSSTFEGFHF
ncbi:hypothetical protein K0M31_000600 [Melipona bicolor]|uniref:Uncharacterized protein n=1 Tax=Melipona bicolor TaxID=60889 RepID=A0AA40GDV5_9HYME|nr:hypothetical protein K0M31_000600 [Melipona bicolor]